MESFKFTELNIRNMSTSTYFIIVALATSFNAGSCLVCDDPSDLTTGTCAQLSKDLERALLQDEGNLFRIRRFFFHSPTATPVLLKVLYNVTFGENFTMAVAAEEVPRCSNPSLNSTIELKQRNITLGWTSSGVYTMFHPTVLSVMQVQTPFAFLRIIHLTLDHQRSPEADTFLWDGSYDLPTVHINLHVTSLSCVPSQDLFESVLGDLNTLLKLYGGRQDVLDLTENVEFVGFTLPDTSVTSEIIPISSDVILANLYSTILCFLYAVSISLITFLYYYFENVKKKINDLINADKDLTMGIRITTTTALVVEFCTRLATCIIWTQNIHNSSGIVLAVWTPQIYLLLMAVWQILFVSIYVCCEKGHCHTQSELRTFSNLSATAFTLFYLLFPTIILMFAYPTQIIVIFTFVISYLFATSVFSASVVKLYNRFSRKGDHQSKQVTNDQQSESDQNNNPQQSSHRYHPHNYHPCKWLKKKIITGWESLKNLDWKKILKKILRKFLFIVLLFMPLWLIIVYLHFIVVFASYSLLIGRGSVINTGPLFLISLLPSALLSGIAWIAKRVALETDQSENNTEAGSTHQPSENKENGNLNGFHAPQQNGCTTHSQETCIELEMNAI